MLKSTQTSFGNALHASFWPFPILYRASSAFYFGIISKTALNLYLGVEDWRLVDLRLSKRQVKVRLSD